MSNEYCVGVIGLRNGCTIRNPISYDRIIYECLIQVDPKRFLLDVKKTPEFILKPIDNNTRLGLFFNPCLSEKCLKRDSKYRIVEQFFDIPDDESNDSSERVSISVVPSTLDVYSMLHDAHEQRSEGSLEVKLPKFFLPTLRQYQSNALQWMLSRERVKSYQVQEFVPVKCHSISNKMFYFNDRTVELLDYEPQLTMPTGGILADEMGLGKTVEILALILSNPRLKRKLNDDNEEPVKCSPSMHTKSKFRCLCRDITSKAKVVRCPKCSYWQHEKCVAKYSITPISNYKCPECWKFEQPVQSSTTFIACPSSIKNQWNKEIRRHISSPTFKIFDYNGMKQEGWISPLDLAKYDVVLCDYNAMRSEIHYTNRNKVHNTRGQAFIVPESPLMKVYWWRVVLDEAQMVESPTNHCSKMVKSLPAVHRWAVTGTPIDKSIDDLYGLMVFLDCEPYNDRSMWTKLTDAFKNGDARPLIDRCLKQIMWRTSKSHVSTEMGIPEQQEIVHNVKMDELEARFYSNQHSECELEFYRTVAKLTRPSDGIRMNSSTLKLIMEPLRKLRRDCTVPTIVQQKIQGGLPVHKIIKTPAELHEHMVGENERACNQALKIIASCFNVLAERHLKNRDTNAAIEMHEHVLSLVKNCTDYVCIKSKVPLKSLRNLLEIAKSGDQNSFQTKAECLKQIERLEWPYVLTINDLLQDIRKNQIELEKEITVHTNDESTMLWWNDFSNITNENMEEQMVDAVNQIKCKFPLHVSVTTMDDIRALLHSWLKMIETERGNLKNAMHEHQFFSIGMKPPILMCEETLNQIDDHDDGLNFETSVHDSDSLCLLCHKYEVTDVLVDYQSVIFDSDRKRSYGEEVLRAISTILLDELSVDDSMLKDVKKHFQVLSLLKKEFKEYDNYLKAIENGIRLLQDLRMKTPRMDSLQSLNESELRSRKQTADENFNKSFQILKYVKHLENSKHLNIECPICFELPTEKECVLQCGHKLCCACFVRIKNLHPITYTCHSCRNIQYTDNTYLVFKNAQEEPSTVVPIAGDYSKKIEEIVRTALKLLKSDPAVKILIFSHWNDILKIIATALSQNGVQSRMRSTKFDKSIDEFKNKDLKVTCLLLPLACGSKGLNLIEATHTFLVEPILDQAEEFQAIGRIHRIGQTKPTFVHRFIVLNTIEETIFTTVSKDMAGKWKNTNVTVDSLREFFTQYRQIN